MSQPPEDPTWQQPTGGPTGWDQRQWGADPAGPQQGWPVPPEQAQPGQVWEQGGSDPGSGHPPWGTESTYAPHPYATPQQHHTPVTAAGSATPLRVLLQIAAPVLVVAGLALPENDGRGYEDWTAWAVFATVAALVQLAPLASSALGMSTTTAWTVGAAGAVALVGYWVIIVLPSVSTNTSFAQTLGVACAAVACWLSPGRRL